MDPDHLAPSVGNVGRSARLFQRLQPGPQGMQLQSEEGMKQRGPDRRWKKDGARLLPDRRDGLDRRAMVKGAVLAGPASIRPAPGEARPFVERRRYPDSGME